MKARGQAWSKAAVAGAAALVLWCTASRAQGAPDEDPVPLADKPAPAPAPAPAAKTTKLAVLVANHKGGDDLPVLRYAERDAQRLSDVLQDLGGFSGDDIRFYVDEEAQDVLEALDELEVTIAQEKGRGHDVLVVFYYSGHAANGVLRLGDTRLGMQELKVRIESLGADMRLAFLDSCGAGAITREKGGTKAPPFVMTVEDNLKARGQVIITSSSADEASQESDDIQGSFFTHYLTTGLRGAADKNDDGTITLGEAYQYAYHRTVTQTAQSRSGVQHPTYQYDLTGAGDVVLAKTRGADVELTFPQELSGRYFVVDMDREIFVAEIEKVAGQAQKLSLPKGEYVIKKRLDTHLLMSRLEARNKGSFVVDESGMKKVEFDDDYAKGTPLSDSDFEDGLGWSLGIGTGGQFVFDEPGTNMFPPIVFLTVQTRATNVFTRHLQLQFDMGAGLRQHTWIVPELGQQYDMIYSQVQASQTILFNWDLGPFTLGGGPRMTALLVVANYTGPKPLGQDAYFFHPFVPGLMAYAGWRPTEWFHVEAQVRGNYLYMVNDSRHLAYVEALFVAWLDL